MLLTSVLSYDADPTGNKPSDEAFRVAIQNAPNIAIPAGNYIFDAPINLLNTDKVRRLIGAGTSETILRFANSDGIINSKRGTIIENLNINGNRSANGSGILIKSGCVINNVRSGSNGRYGVEFNPDGHVIRCHIDNMTLDYNILGGLHLKAGNYSQKNNISLKKLYVLKNGLDVDNLQGLATPDSGHGIVINGGVGISIEDCVAEYNSGAGLYVSCENGYAVRGLTVTNMYYEFNKYIQLLLNASYGNWTNVDIRGSAYNIPFAFPANSLEHIATGHKAIYGQSLFNIAGYSNHWIDGQKQTELTYLS